MSQYWLFFGPGWKGVVTFGGGVNFGFLRHRVDVSERKREARARDGVRAAERGGGFPSEVEFPKWEFLGSGIKGIPFGIPEVHMAISWEFPGIPKNQIIKHKNRA